ncbi:MAG: RNA methyltransferase [Acidobacteriota bacterium]|nr:RNA methyltransferase [Acidobacteriota bacterium]
MSVEITSRQNPVVRACRELARDRDGDRVLLDGPHLVEEALDAGLAFEAVIASHAFAAGHAQLVSRLRAHTQVYLADDSVLEGASPVKTAVGIVAIASLPLEGMRRTLDGTAALAVALVDVQDPGNAGAVMRSVEAAAGTGVIACGETADLRGWRALRASMGSAFRVPFAEASVDQLFNDAKVAGAQIVASTLGAASRDMRDADLRKPTILLIGNEGRGLAPALEKRADLRVRIPMHGKVQSLNAAVSAAVLLYEAQRQRASADASATHGAERSRP